MSYSSALLAEFGLYESESDLPQPRRRGRQWPPSSKEEKISRAVELLRQLRAQNPVRTVGETTDPDTVEIQDWTVLIDSDQMSLFDMYRWQVVHPGPTVSFRYFTRNSLGRPIAIILGRCIAGVQDPHTGETIAPGYVGMIHDADSEHKYADMTRANLTISATRRYVGQHTQRSAGNAPARNVYYRGGRHHASIAVGGGRVQYLGSYETAEEANDVYMEVVRRLEQESV